MQNKSSRINMCYRFKSLNNIIKKIKLYLWFLKMQRVFYIFFFELIINLAYNHKLLNLFILFS